MFSIFLIIFSNSLLRNLIFVQYQSCYVFAFRIVRPSILMVKGLKANISEAKERGVLVISVLYVQIH